MLAAGALVAALAVPATAQNSASSLIIKGGVKVKPGESITDNQRFAPSVIRVRSGANLRIANRANTKDPHTVSLVRANQIPKTAGRVNGCFEGGPCASLMQAHEVPEGDGPPGKPLVNVGAEGFDQPGDSIVLMKKNESVKVTARAGTNLYFLCAVHPWMSGRIQVR